MDIFLFEKVLEPLESFRLKKTLKIKVRKMYSVKKVIKVQLKFRRI